MTIKKQIQIIVNRDVINTEQRNQYIEVLKKIRDEKFVSKKEIENVMSQYIVLTDDIINKYLLASTITTANYEALKEVEKTYHQGIKELNEMMDKENYPKND